MTFQPLVLDLSHHNTVNSPTMIADYGVKGVILKCTQSTNYVDPTYEKRKVAFENAGLLVGAYHFASGAVSAEKQLDFFLEHSGLTEKNLGALDFEPDTTSGRNMTLEDARDWLANFEHTLGRKAKFYSGNLIKETLGNTPDAFLGAHDLWFAHYNSHPEPFPRAWDKCWLWQYCDQARTNLTNYPHAVSGVTGPGLDCNFFDGTAEELAASWTR